MFIGRENELNILKDLLKLPTVSAMVYGKRKVGKTTLIKEVLKFSKDETIYYECLKAPMSDNIEGFVSELVRQKVLPATFLFKSLIDIFAYLNTLNKTFNIVIDEYPYLKVMSEAKEIDSIFQSIIDNNLKNIRLFISGSHIGMMKDLMEENNALYGRFKTVICLKELNYLQASDFYKSKSIYDKIALYSVFGGSPYINNEIDQSKSLKDNIVNTILNPSSAVYVYAEHLLITDYKNALNAERIFYAISNGHKKYSDIENKLGLKTNGNLSKQLSSLVNMEIIAKVNPINKLDDNKKAYYEVKDNLLRFYYTYIYKNKSALQMLGADAFYEEYIKNSLTTFISHRFEEIVRTYFSLCVQNKKLSGVLNIGSFYYDNKEDKTNGEFDVALKRKENYDIYEVKYYTSPLSLKEMLKEEKQIKAIKGIKIGKIGFVSTAGFESKEQFDCIDANDLYN